MTLRATLAVCIKSTSPIVMASDPAFQNLEERFQEKGANGLAPSSLSSCGAVSRLGTNRKIPVQRRILGLSRSTHSVAILRMVVSLE